MNQDNKLKAALKRFYEARLAILAAEVALHNANSEKKFAGDNLICVIESLGKHNKRFGYKGCTYQLGDRVNGNRTIVVTEDLEVVEDN